MSEKISRTKVLIVIVMILISVLVSLEYKVTDETKLEFNKYLSNKYPQLELKMESVQYDPISRHVFAEVKVVDANFSFNVSKDMKKKYVFDNYEDMVKIDLINNETKRVFKGTTVEKYVVKMYQKDMSWLNTNGEHKTMKAFWLELYCVNVKDEIELSKIVEESIKAMTNRSYDVKTVYVMGSLSGKAFWIRIVDKASLMTYEEIMKHIEY